MAEQSMQHRPVTAPSSQQAGSTAGPAPARLVQLATMLGASTAVRQLAPLKKKLTQKLAIQRKGKDEELAQRAAFRPGAEKGGLPPALKSGIETMSGMAMDHVRVHYNSDRPAQLNAHAYAQGSDIHLAPGQQQHLPHEAWHVVQQAQGRVRPTMKTQGVTINDDRGLEREADHMGQRALRTT